MAVITIKRGLNLPIQGPLHSNNIIDGPAVSEIALLPGESWGIRVRMLAQVGDAVQIGTPLFCDKRDPDVLYTSPAGGTLKAVHRGERRAVLSVVVEVGGHEEAVEFLPVDPGKASRDDLVAALQPSGLWPNLRQRPFNKVAVSSETPRSIFVTAIDTAPQAVSPRELLAGREDDFRAGLTALTQLSGGATYLCTSPKDNWSELMVDGVKEQAFGGKHPAGNAGVHIHHLDPVGQNRTAWHIDVQGVAEIGAFLRSGKVPTERRVAVAGPAAKEAAIVNTRRGAATKAFQDYAAAEVTRFVNGSALDGATADPGTVQGFLGRYSRQLTLIDDAPEREFLGWTKPIGSRWSLTNTYFAKFLKKSLRFDTDVNGGERAIVPLGNYEKVMPMDILPTQLIKAIASDDLEGAEKLGVLELAEEDIALCQYVCPSKIDMTDMLRAMLTRIEKEG